MSSIQNRVEWLVLWQRASGGFAAGQQRELAQRVMADLGLASAKAKKPNPQVERESWRLLASLERLDVATRVKIGDEVVRRLRRDEGNASLLWSIGRLGARTPIYGPLTSVVAASDAGRWLEELVANERSTPEVFAAIVQLGALTGDPLRDLDELVLDAARQRLRDAGVDRRNRRALWLRGLALGTTTQNQEAGDDHSRLGHRDSQAKSLAAAAAKSKYRPGATPICSTKRAATTMAVIT